jgi:hypothetical protein
MEKNLLTDLGAILSRLGIPHETGAFTKPAPDTYAVLLPLGDDFAVEGDGLPLDERQEVRISLFSRGNYLALKGQIERALLRAKMCITERRYLGRENETGYHHAIIGVENLYAYGMEE